jgi:hypothetical protein
VEKYHILTPHLKPLFLKTALIAMILFATLKIIKLVRHQADERPVAPVPN